MPTRIMFHNLKKATARTVGDSNWLDLTDSDGNTVTVFMPKWIAESAARCLTECLMTQEDMDAQAVIAAEENARYCSHGGGMYRSPYPSIKDNDYDS